jgi:microsomal dipeptidase-like Zn-dependent dipeptidase
VRSRADLEAYLARRASEPEITAGWLGIEGAQALDGRLENLDRLYDAGVRMVGLAHFFDNEFAGSAHGVSKGGLSEAGRELIRRIEARRMLVDLAHASPPTIDQVLQMATRPLVVSHTGVRGTCDNARNLSDEHLRGIARTGGVVGIGYWETAVCGTDPAAIARAIQYAVRIAGIDHVGLGSDYDGAVTVPFDTSQLALLTEALLKAGFNDDEIARLMGGNALRVLRASLP